MKTIILTILVLCPCLLSAQCDESKKERAIRGSMGYQSRGAHCEGFFGSLVSANDLNIVNFSKGRLAYSSTSPEVITLSVPVSTAVPVNVRGLGIPRNLYYQMDVTVNSYEKFEWNTGTVLLKNQSTKYARLLGILGFTVINGRRVYVPIQVNAADRAFPYEIKLVASTKVTQLKWRLRGRTEFQSIRGGRPFTPGRTIPITLPKDIPAGEYTLEVQGKESDGVTDISKLLKIQI